MPNSFVLFVFGALLVPASVGGAAPGIGGAKSDIDSDETVVFFPTVGRQVDGGKSWELEIHGWIFEREWRASLLTGFGARLGLRESDADVRAEFRRRAGFFLVDNERGERISIRMGDQVCALNPSRPNGHFEGVVRLSSAEVDKLKGGGSNGRSFVEFEAVTDVYDDRRFEGRVWLVPETGVTIISDVDDTIKISEVTDKKALLRNTFLKAYRAAPGMAELFQGWSRKEEVSFHYVSASPWQLFEPLHEFIGSAGFPVGAMALKPFRWKDESFLELFKSPMEYKLEVIEPIIGRFPRRRFVLVGDSGEKDPEAYGELARRHPDRIVRILVRDVTSEAPDSERYLKAFKDIPADRWTIFKDPVEIQAGPP